METVFEMLMQKYNEAAEPLKERQEANRTRVSRREWIGPALETLNARVNVLGRSIDEAVATSVNADQLKAQRTECQEQIITLQNESEALSQEIIREREEIEQVFKQLAARVLKEQFPAIREKTLAKIRECVESLDAAWSDLQKYEHTTAPCLTTMLHRDGLIPREYLSTTDENKLYRRVQYWFGGK